MGSLSNHNVCVFIFMYMWDFMYACLCVFMVVYMCIGLIKEIIENMLLKMNK